MDPAGFHVTGPLLPDCAPALSALVRRVFVRFEAPDYPPEGLDTFFAYTDPSLLSFAVLSGMLVVGGCYWEDRLIGAIALRDGTHISLLFVEAAWHRRGIGTALVEWAVKRMLTGRRASFDVTVNASSYAQAFYEHAGFYATAEEQEKDGIRFIPMTRRIVV